MLQFSFVKAEILGLFLETLLSGAHSVLYAISVWILMYRWRLRRPGRSRTRFNWWMFVVITTMYMLAIAHLVLDLLHIMTAFVEYGHDPGSSLSYYEHQGTIPTFIASPVFFVLLALEGDFLMTYRIYTVWGREIPSLALSMLLIAGHLISASLVAHELYKSPIDASDGLLSPAVYGPMIAYFAMTLLANVLTTLLLLGRISWHDRKLRRAFEGYTSASQAHWQLMKTIMQSEALYSSGVVINLVLYIVRSNGVYVTFATLPPLVGISFTMIIARIGLNDTLDNSNGALHSSDVSTLRVAYPPHMPCQSLSASEAPASPGNMAPIPIPISVHISRTVESELIRDDGTVASFERHDKRAVNGRWPTREVIHLRPSTSTPASEA
ncbi:hypothetical protein FKP32DRAFT_1191120 [Trametes sanguinea]|nr:hypothetical protein FKP32DRAFT_1191120 [Trametes sanguinea]